MPLYNAPASSGGGGTDLDAAITINESGSDADFRVESSGNANMLMVDAGNNRVGIGTGTPSTSLEIQDGLTTTGAVLTLSTKEPSVVASDVLGQINFQAPLDTGLDSDLVGASIQALATATFSDTVNATALLFNTGASETANEKMRITSDGKVGIGTSTPVSLVEIQGGTTTAGAILTLSTKETSVVANDVLGQIHFQAPLDTGVDSDVVGAAIQALATDTFSDTVNATDLIFKTAASGTASEKMRITSASTISMTSKLSLGVSGAAHTPANTLYVSHDGSDTNDGVMIVRADSTTSDGDLLGGIGFDSTDGNVPSSVLESSAFIASIATENHATTDKGGNLKFGVSLINEDDDTVSTIVANVGQPDTITASSGAAPTTHPGLNSRATTVVLGNGTYSPTIADSGVLVIFENANSTLALPSINNNTSAGVQFTVFNETASAISAKITVQNSATINGGAATALDDIDSFKAATFVCSGNNTWIRIG